MKFPYIKDKTLFRTVSFARKLNEEENKPVDDSVKIAANYYNQDFNLVREKLLEIKAFNEANPVSYKTQKALDFIRMMLKGGLKESEAIITASNFYNIPVEDLIAAINKKKKKEVKYTSNLPKDSDYMEANESEDFFQ